MGPWTFVAGRGFFAHSSAGVIEKVSSGGYIIPDVQQREKHKFTEERL